jgi:hypothetical protein
MCYCCFLQNTAQKILVVSHIAYESSAVQQHCNTATLQRKYTENSKHIFPEMKLRGLSPNSYIYVSVSNLYIPTIDLPIQLQGNSWTHRGNI